MSRTKPGTGASPPPGLEAAPPGLRARVLAWPRACAFLLGALTVCGYAPVYLYPLPIATLAALLVLVEGAPGPRAAAGIGFAFGLGLFLAGVSWVYVSLHDFGAMPAPVAAGTTLLFCAYLALYPALAAAATRRAGHDLARRCLVFPGAWVLAEWVRGWLFTGFPWLAVGYSQAPASPLAGLAPVLGVFGVGYAVVACAGLLVAILGRRTVPEMPARALPSRFDWRLRSAPAAALVVLITASGLVRTIEWTQPSGEPFEASLLQGNVPQDMKWRPEQVAATLATYREMIEAAPGKLVVLPETALPLFLQNVPRDYLDALERSARSRNADILLGLPERGSARDYYNSVISLGSSPPQSYRKVHLVPFGEFIPLRPLLASIVESLAIPLTDFGRGSEDQQPLAVAGERVAVNICYEDAFGDEIIRQLPQATVLVNVSNVAWFGDSAAPMQHLQIAQMRALETGRYMLRATNTGMTAIVDPRGRITAIAPMFSRTTVTGQVRGHGGATPFVQVGNSAAIALCVLAIAGAFALARAHGRGPRLP
jgi:apolipoprotein N-acyltransferase